MKTTSSATIHDVAKAASVSVASVSRYINGTAFVSKDTGARIATAIDTLRYSPNKMAQALKTERSNLIMMVVPDIGNQYYAEQYKTIQAIGAQHRYAIMLHSSNERIENEFRAIEVAREHQCDGLIMFSSFNDPEISRRLDFLSIPISTVPGWKQKTNYEAAICLTTRHLIEYGHRNILYVGGAESNWINIQRRNGFIRAMDEAGYSYNPSDWFEMDFTTAAGYKAGKYISAMPNRPTAICAANDQLAFGLIMALQESGIRVPEDISITGMDDVEFSRLLNPSLTTICNDPRPIAEYLINNLLNMINGGTHMDFTGPENTPQVIIRSSTRNISGG